MELTLLDPVRRVDARDVGICGVCRFLSGVDVLKDSVSTVVCNWSIFGLMASYPKPVRLELKVKLLI